MREQPIPPFMARMLVADEDALTSPARMVFCHNDETGVTLFGGRAVIGLSDKIKDQEWHLAEGTMIFVPRKIFDWKRDSQGNDRICGWTLEDLVIDRDGLSDYNWEDRKNKSTKKRG